MSMPDPPDYAEEEAEYDSLEGESCSTDEEVDLTLDDIALDTGAKAEVSSADAERVQENIANRVPSWRGVRSCNDKARAKAAAQPVAQAWVNAKIAANPDREVAGAGYSGEWRYRNETTGSGRRKCKGWWTKCVVYVDFVS